MSHGRVFYRCGCLRLQCRCPGPHVDTVLPVACDRHASAYLAALQEAMEATMRRVLEIHPWLDRLRLEDDRDRLIDDARD